MHKILLDESHFLYSLDGVPNSNPKTLKDTIYQHFLLLIFTSVVKILNNEQQRRNL